MTSAAKGLNVADLLEAPGLTSSLRDRLQAADANGDGVISASEMIDVIQSEITATRDRKVMQRVLIALGVACLLIIAAVVGLTYAVVEMSKDTSVQNNVLVGKDGLQPLSTATLQKTVQLADLYKASSPSELDWLTHVTVPFGKGEAVLKIQNVYLVPGERARFDTAAENVSVEVTADGVTVSGDEQAPGGRRRLMQENEASASGKALVTAESSDAGPNGFFRDGNTIKCPDAKVGGNGTVDGVLYTKVNRDRLKGLLENRLSLLLRPALTEVCTTGVTDMSELFKDEKAFNSPIGHWDTSSVTTMYGMFQDAWLFNQDIKHWDTSSVTTMKNMFSMATSFDQPIGDWDTAKVTDMEGMFMAAPKFNQNISGWNTAAVMTMKGMFKNAWAFNQDIKNWDTAAVTTMEGMFKSARAFNQDIKNWDTSSVTTMKEMFMDAQKFNQDSKNWNTAKVTDMQQMFNEANSFNQDIGGWNTAAVTTMEGMFKSARAFNQPIGTWDTSSVTTMKKMFMDAQKFNQDIKNWNTAKVTDMAQMFNLASAFSQDLSGWDVNAVTGNGKCNDFGVGAEQFDYVDQHPKFATVSELDVEAGEFGEVNKGWTKCIVYFNA